jgi:2-dehydro-3-deoxyphosphogluconate aldolase/(4S)-4-hydroxy-2-oxoglutarate aldolase
MELVKYSQLVSERTIFAFGRENKVATDLSKILESSPVVPLVQADDPAIAVKTSRALAAGGLTVVEVVFRTDHALECLKAVADEVPEIVAGAGTVLSASQAEAAFDAGAQFIVSPGLDDGVVAVAQERGAPVYPGIVTP